jgi:hypothetical protein
MSYEPQQPEFPSFAFPKDRTVLYVTEVAMKLRETEQHVLDLIEEGKLQAINIGGGGRNFWRIPVKAYKAFLSANHSFRL